MSPTARLAGTSVAAAGPTPGLASERTLAQRLWRFAFARSRRRPMGLFSLSPALEPLSWLTVEIPKRIVNDPMLGPPASGCRLGLRSKAMVRRSR